MHTSATSIALLSGLTAFIGSTSAQDASPTNLTSLAAHLERFWSYGRSPPVYPTPEGSGAGDWGDAYARARDLVSQMTNDEKNNITYGHPSTANGCSGNSGSVPRLSFPGLCLADSGNGVRATDGVNAYPPGMHIGASWNKQLAHSRAHYMGAEFKRKGVNVALGPVIGPLGRVARGGRNWEGFSNDPYLSGSLAYETVQGLQENVIACVKHFIGNEQETERNPPLLRRGALNQSSSSNIDDKAMHELYMWPFQDAVRAGAGAIMCTYQKINGSYGCQNSKTLNGLLNGELGFQGFVVTDWGAQHSGLASAEAGLDMVMPSSSYWQDGNLTLMVTNGSLPQSRLDDMATRIVASWYRYSESTSPGTGLSNNLLAPHVLVDARDPASKKTIMQGAIEGHVLVKNTNGALPLKKSPRLLSLFGYDAYAPLQNTPTTGSSFPKWPFGLESTQTIPGVGYFNDTYLGSLFLSSEPADAPTPDAALNGTLWTGGGSGATTPAYIDAPFDAFQRRARSDNTFLLWDFYSPAPSVEGASEACVVFINAVASEGWDRPNLADSYSDNLVEHVASQCNNTMVVIHNAGIRLVDRWIDNANITAVIYAHMPGQDSGQALVDIMYGAVSPSGRLPYTVAKRERDYGNTLGPALPSPAELWHTQDNFTEGVFIDYKHFLAHNITPRFAFGYGLTYSEFQYSGLQVQKVAQNSTYQVGSNTTTTTPTPEGGDPALFHTIAEVSCTIANTGAVPAAEVAQLYVHIPGGPDRVLRGFEKVLIQPGESASVRFGLTRKDLSAWDVVAQRWVVASGEVAVWVGKSVLDGGMLRGGLEM
ncbi:beta-glucosidase M [Massariosphaeria phaeospora]|uniref:beta-glucosidase n=1 Tax=Massariosphaeria phaeospora TaxID=100035 RepID=A0A7C8ICD6_9PLEO|nr:beta-glucosidase M [Massariosphaeria phaeospora]